MRLYKLLPAVLLLSGLSLADTTSTPVPVNSTVLNSCVFNLDGAATITIPTYKAADVSPVSGQTTVGVLCNKGTQPITTYWANEPDLNLALKATNNDILNVTLGYGTDPEAPTAGLNGGDLWSYVLTATPVAGQYGASSQTTYTNTADYIVAF